MTDMLCSLIHLPKIEPLIAKVKESGITVRRPNPWEQTKLREFIIANFAIGWADEASVAFSHQPVSCFIAIHDKQIVGFAAYECTRRNYFGPTGVLPQFGKRGIGSALLVASLYGLQDLGYTYAVIGSVSSTDYYQKTVGAIEINMENGDGIYKLTEDAKFLSI